MGDLQLNVGTIRQTNVAPKGIGAAPPSSTDGGSLLALKYIKDDTIAFPPVNFGTVDIKNWFSQYIGGLGKFTKREEDDTNISWGDYRGATILGMRIQAKNEQVSRYKNANNATLRIKILNGSGVNGAYTLTVGDVTEINEATGEAFNVVTSNGNRNSVYETAGFNSGDSVRIRLTDNSSGVMISMTWTTGYDAEPILIRGSGSVAGPGFTWSFDNPSGTSFTSTADALYFFSGLQTPERPYGIGYGLSGV